MGGNVMCSITDCEHNATGEMAVAHRTSERDIEIGYVDVCDKHRQSLHKTVIG